MVKKAHGQIRQSQLITTFGPGAMLDLPRYSVLVGGLEGWSPLENPIHEPRLAGKLAQYLQVPRLSLYPPPPEEKQLEAKRSGIGVWQFPEWFVVDAEAAETRERYRGGRLIVHRRRLDRGMMYRDADRKLRPAVPIRFVRACVRGHIDDIDWYAFVHQGRPCKRNLVLFERTTMGDLGDIELRCECGAERRMSDAMAADVGTLGRCTGQRPWLGPNSREPCDQKSRLLVRGATHAYFPQIMSVISLPETISALAEKVEQRWETLKEIRSADDLAGLFKIMGSLGKEFSEFPVSDVFAEIVSRRERRTGTEGKPVRIAEIETLTAPESVLRKTRSEIFDAQVLPEGEWREPWLDMVERVLLVHRLREVIALAGFTRFEPATADIQGELDLQVKVASLAIDADWRPAVENRGEGIFIGFKPKAIEAWAAKDATAERGRKLGAGFASWQKEHPQSKRQFPGLPYLMLHSVSHMLITAITLECGYPSSSIRERIYAGPAGYGIMLYTSSPDAEGTLGGLVETGKEIGRHLRAALRWAELCSNDPVCSGHDPEDDHDKRFLHGAACHGCLLIAETSCEQHNELLDRALVVPTLASSGAAFFQPVI